MREKIRWILVVLLSLLSVGEISADNTVVLHSTTPVYVDFPLASGQDCSPLYGNQALVINNAPLGTFTAEVVTDPSTLKLKIKITAYANQLGGGTLVVNGSNCSQYNTPSQSVIPVSVNTLAPTFSLPDAPNTTFTYANPTINVVEGRSVTLQVIWNDPNGQLPKVFRIKKITNTGTTLIDTYRGSASSTMTFSNNIFSYTTPAIVTENAQALLIYQILYGNENPNDNNPQIYGNIPVVMFNISITSPIVKTPCSIINPDYIGYQEDGTCGCNSAKPHMDSNGKCRVTDPSKGWPCPSAGGPQGAHDSYSCLYTTYGQDYAYVLNGSNAAVDPVTKEKSFQINMDTDYELQILQTNSNVLYDIDTDKPIVKFNDNVLQTGIYTVNSQDGSASFNYNASTRKIRFTSNPTDASKNIGRLTLQFRGVPNWMSCCTLDPLIITVGGSDKTLPPVDCPLELPTVLNQIGWGSDITHMTWTITSSTYITVKPGVTLSNGGKLLLNHPADINPTDDNSTDDPYINWKQLTVFDDYGEPIGQLRNYFDQKGVLMQSQNKSFQQDRGALWASQSIEDTYGRPATLQTLPAPIAGYDATTPVNQGRVLCGVQIDAVDKYIPISYNIQVAQNLPFEYDANFIKNATGDPYSYKDFDGTKTGTPTALTADASTGKLGWYYSAANNSASNVSYKEPNTPVTGYPYVQTVYDNDGTDDVKSVVSPGDAYRGGGTTASHAGVSATTIVANDAANDVTDPYVLNYVAMYAGAFPGQTFQPMNNVYKHTVTDADGKAATVYYDKEDKPLIVVQAAGSSDETSAFSFYNSLGRLRYTLSPKSANGFAVSNNTNNFSTLDRTEYNYDFSGNLTSVSDPDQGITKYQYTRDGKLRFSENAEQRASSPKRISYTNYDAFDRPSESGEYTCNSCTFSFDNITNDDIENNNALTGYTKGEYIKTYYDGDSNGSLASFTQNYIAGSVSSIAKYKNASTLISQSWYSYDERGRLKVMKQKIPALSSDPITIDYKYNNFGSVMEVAYQRGQTEQFYHYYDYTNDGKMNTVYIGTTAPVYTYPNGATDIALGDPTATSLAGMIPVATYDYYLHGPLKKVDYYQAVAGSANVIQTQEYIYTSEGWLKGINHPVLNDNIKKQGNGNYNTTDRFAMTMEYYDGDYTKNSVKSLPGAPGINNYNGNPRAISIFNKKLSPTCTINAYTYDQRDYLNLVNTGVPDYDGGKAQYDPLDFKESFNYDANGNMIGISKYGPNGEEILKKTASDFTYENNKVKNIAGYGGYTYNKIGQTISAKLPNSQSADVISYNPYGTTAYIQQGTNHNTKYTYDEAGNRISIEDVTGNTTTKTWFVYDISGNLLCKYEGTTPAAKEWYIYGATRIGKVTKNNTDYAYDYEITDHLGNVRATIDAEAAPTENYNSSDQALDYYAYGASRSTGTDYPFGYQGQFSEIDEATELQWFKLRAEDVIIPHWYTPDPYGQYYSPYIAMGNNPITGVDADGGKVIFENGYARRSFNKAYRYLKRFGAQQKLDQLIGMEAKIKLTTTIAYSDFDPNTATIDWNPRRALGFDESGTLLSPAILLIHEAYHAVDFGTNLVSHNIDKLTNIYEGEDGKININEARAVMAETNAARLTGEIGANNISRKNYLESNKSIITKGPTSRLSYQDGTFFLYNVMKFIFKPRIRMRPRFE